MKIGPYDIYQPVVPVVYPLCLLKLVQRYGISTEDALLNVGYSETELNQPGIRVTTEQWATQTLRAIELCGDIGLGIELGLQMRMSSHGLLGFAIMTAPTVKHALKLLENFFRTRVLHYQLVYKEENNMVILEVQPLIAIPPLLHRFYVESFFVNLSYISQLTSNPIEDITFHFPWSKPEYYDKFSRELPASKFNKPISQILFPSSYIDNKLNFADETSYYQATEIVEREYLSLLGDQKDLITQVREKLVLDINGYPQINEIAEHLHMSERTLRRKLVDAGTGFQCLLDEVRYCDSKKMLSDSNLDIQAIAIKLGFQDPANFTRAFKKWGDQTPIQYRKQVLLKNN